MSSILALVALQTAHAGSATVPAGADGAIIQTSLDVLCRDSNPNTLTFPPGEVNVAGGDLLVYPNPDAAEHCADTPGPLTIVGNPNQRSTIVIGAANAPQSLFTFVTPETGNFDVTFRNLTIRGLQFGDPGTEGLDPFGFLDDLEDVVVTQCAGRSAATDILNPALSSRGIYVDGTNAGASSEYTKLSLEDVTMRCLYGVGDGGAVLVEGGAVEVSDSFFLGNFASASGGAVAVKHGGGADRYDVDPSVATLAVSDNTRFERNNALFGGAISNYAGLNASTVTDSYFFSNTGDLGAGAVQFENQSFTTLERNQFDEQNSEQFDVGQRGGAVTVEMTDNNDGELMFKNNIVCGSWAGRGGGLYVDSVQRVDVLGSVFAENGAIEFGGGVYFIDSRDEGMDINVTNNTFAGNESGRLPDFVTTQFQNNVIGGGGAASFFGVNPIFQNNVVSYTGFGGGVFGEYVPFTTNGYEIGDALVIYNNLFFQNTDGAGSAHITGDFASIASHPSNVVNSDPLMQYLGLGEFNCVPEAFYTPIDSPVIDAGGGPPAPGTNVPTTCLDMVDTDLPQDFMPDTEDGPCDIGAFGGEFALWRKDSDQDGFANLFDCNDLDPDIAPGLPEVCDFDDNDCNGIVDDNLPIRWYPDLDQDLHGDQNAAFELNCNNPGNGLVPNNDDCDDNNTFVHADAGEICDGIDNDCDQEIDEDITFVQYFPDGDGDGFGAPGGVESCEPPGAGFVTISGDCADNDAARNPDGVETCGNQIDDDCDGFVDAEDLDAVGVERFFPDIDGDGFGDDTQEIRRCSGDPPEGFIIRGGDCDDTTAAVSPGSPELCMNQGVDEDCDGEVDEVDGNTLDALKIYADSDGDEIGSSQIFDLVCELTPPPGFVESFGDCDDNDPQIGECSAGLCGCSAAALTPFSGLMFGMVLLGLVGRRR